eukprot:50434_1
MRGNRNSKIKMVLKWKHIYDVIYQQVGVGVADVVKDVIVIAKIYDEVSESTVGKVVSILSKQTYLNDVQINYIERIVYNVIKYNNLNEIECTFCVFICELSI